MSPVASLENHGFRPTRAFGRGGSRRSEQELHAQGPVAGTAVVPERGARLEQVGSQQAAAGLAAAFRTSLSKLAQGW
jgi:hypothetical protein